MKKKKIFVQHVINNLVINLNKYLNNNPNDNNPNDNNPKDKNYYAHNSP
jgi:hypothetical protein